MTSSILTNIRELIGLDDEEHSFDTDIILYINSALAIAHQLGVGKQDFLITGPDETWDMLEIDQHKLNLLKQYVYLKVRYVFDPPVNSFTQESIKSQFQELEWRLNVSTEGEKDG